MGQNSQELLDSLHAEKKPHHQGSGDEQQLHQKLLDETQPPAPPLYVLKPGLPLQKDASMQPQADEQTKKIFENVSPAVVKVAVPDGAGSGFFFDKEGDIATDAHVVLGENQVDVITKDGKKMPAKIVALDDVDDIAVLRVDGGTPSNIKPLELAPNAELNPDDNMWAIGHPRALDPLYISPGYYQADTTPAGILKDENSEEKLVKGLTNMTPKELDDAKKALTRDLEQGKIHIEPGNSGGPVVNADGKVIGLADMTNTSTAETEVTPVSYLASLMKEKEQAFNFGYKFVPADKAAHKFAPNGEYILTDESRKPGDYRAPYTDRFFGGGKFHDPKDTCTDEKNAPSGQHFIGRAKIE